MQVFVSPFAQPPAYDGGIEESLEYVVRAFLVGYEERLYAGGGIGIATGFIVDDAQGIALLVYPVDDASDA